MKNKFLLTLVFALLPTSVFAQNYDYLDNPEQSCAQADDPLEKLNRVVFNFNGFLDHILLKPIAKSYGAVTNESTRKAVNNTLDNLTTPFSSVNYALQGKGGKALMSFWSFVANSLLGVGGMADIASSAGIKVPQQGLGDTLGRYGVGPGPVLVLPIFGMTNVRDMWDLTVADSYGNPINRARFISNSSLGITAARTIHKRYQIMPITDQIAKMPDPYIAIRSALFDARQAQTDYPEGYECGYKKGT